MKINFVNIKSFSQRQKIKKAFFETIKMLGIKNDNIVVNIGYVSESAIQKLNSEHRGVDKVTDVLSFPLINLEVGKWITQDIEDFEKDPVTNLIDIGDIIICENVAVLQSKKYQHSLKREICFLAVHGFLHLLGFDHVLPKEEKNMNLLTENVLKKVGVKR